MSSGRVGDLGKQLERVQSRGDVGAVAETIAAYYETGREGLQNMTVPDYLRGLAEWLAAAPRLPKYKDSGFPEEPNWAVMAEMLWGAAIYE